MEVDCNKLDRIVAYIYGDLVNKAYMNGEISLIDMDYDDSADMCVFRIAIMVSSLTGKPVMVDLTLLEYLLFKWRMRKSKCVFKRYKEGKTISVVELEEETISTIGCKREDIAETYIEYYSGTKDLND